MCIGQTLSCLHVKYLSSWSTFKILYLNGDIYQYLYSLNNQHLKHSLILLLYHADNTNKLHSLLYNFPLQTLCILVVNITQNHK